MMGDLFWDFATSFVVLSIIALIAAAAFIVAHVPKFVERFIPALMPYTKAAALVQVLAALLLFFLIGFRVSDERAEAKQLRNDLAFKELQLKNAQDTANDAERLKKQAEAKASEAKGKLDEFRTKFGDNPEAVCAWTDDELGRLQHLRRAKPR
ncbi:MAG: hypothetical protein V4673_14640 [Pseudomonadota bacterium]